MSLVPLGENDDDQATNPRDRATGKTGSVVVTELLNGSYPVRAMVRREDGRSARLKELGAEIAPAEMCDVERVVHALKDVQRAYYCPPIGPYVIQGAAAFAVMAAEQRWPYHVAGAVERTTDSSFTGPRSPINFLQSSRDAARHRLAKKAKYRIHHNSSGEQRAYRPRASGYFKRQCRK